MNSQEASVQKKGKTCPVCGRATEDRVAPFCSKRCADVDLGRWLSEVYTVPVVALDEEIKLEDDDGAC